MRYSKNNLLDLSFIMHYIEFNNYFPGQKRILNYCNVVQFNNKFKIICEVIAWRTTILSINSMVGKSKNNIYIYVII